MRALFTLVLVAAAAAACATDPPPEPVASPRPTSSPAAACSYKRSDACQGTAPTYEADILPILKRSCFACHANDGMAAEDHDFSKPQVAMDQRNRMAVQVAACAMPPKGAKPIAPADAAILLNWAACSADK